MHLVYAVIILIVLIAIWYRRAPASIRRLERLDRDGHKSEDQPPDGAIDDYIGWSDGE